MLNKRVVILLAILGSILIIFNITINREIKRYYTLKAKAAALAQLRKTRPAEIRKPVELDGIGEEIIYDVKLGKVTLGRSTFKHVSKVTEADTILHLMVFETKLPRFSDTETIYTNPETLLPIRVNRKILKILGSEEITELYDQINFSVTINKQINRRLETSVIKKEGPIQNAILLPHYIRRIKGLKIGQIFKVNLPNRQFDIKLTSIEKVIVPAGTYEAYHFESTPKQIEIWISADERKIPLKIQSTSNFGYLLVLREYRKT